MKSVIRLKESRAGRPVWLAASAAVVLAAVVGGAGVAAGPGNAAAAVKGHKASHRLENPKFKHPKLKHGELTIVGSEASDKIALRLQTGQPGVLQVDVGDDGSADFSFARDRVATIAVDAAAGDDLVRIDESNGVFTDSIPTTIDGGDGNDTIAGGKGAETLLGGDGNDSIDGNGGNDLALLGAGDDTFVWDPGDGSDTVEGQDGADTMRFNGANVTERVALSANGNRLKFRRDPGNVTMDTASVERVDFNALGGADLVFVGDLSGTDVTSVNVDLAATLGGASGDGETDSVVVDGANGDDTINVGGDASGVAVSGLASLVAIQHQEPNDELDVDGLGGNDAISAAALAAQAITLTLDGGTGDDTIAGARGANGNRLRFTRDVAGITMDTNGVERVDFNALGGADLVTVNDLSGTDVGGVNVDLAGTLGGATGDGQPDRVVVNATNNDDTIKVSGDATEVTAKGLAPLVAIFHPEAANDRLEINTLAGSDTVDSDGLAAGAIQLFVDGLLVP